VRRERQLNRLTTLLTVLIGAPTMAIGFLSINLENITAHEGLPVYGAVAFVLLIALTLGLLLFATIVVVLNYLRR
jgi:hypothetical protein